MTPSVSAALVDLVVPTIGRPSLRELLDSLAMAPEPVPRRIILVDDRPFKRPDASTLDDMVPASLAWRVTVIRSGGRGPAAARNRGWREAGARWVAFMDDDVVPPPGWADALVADLVGAPAHVAGVQGRIEVPLPDDRRPTDWERNVRGLELVELPRADECCGFGGTFAIKNAETSSAMLADKCEAIAETGAGVCTAVDGSCLLQIGGGLSRRGAATRAVHLAEILASA